MAENHYVDAKDQHIAAEGVEDHSGLTSAYMQVEKKDLGPWMQEEERQAAMKADRDAAVKGLRKYVVPIGLFASLPVVLGILVGQFALNINLDTQNPSAMAYLIGTLFAAAITLAITFGAYRWIGRRFHDHTLRALPVLVTVIGGIMFLFQKVFAYTNTTIGGLYGYSAALIGLIVIAIVITTITVFAWTASKLPALLKLFVLLLCLGASVAIFYTA